ncbi:MAG TPA: PAS domain-containing sensor histidine kinase [Planctomycetota bacterium]|nr:PAS domain-containing sensor histidine kinase [Planctomycetota bacterium]
MDRKAETKDAADSLRLLMESVKDYAIYLLDSIGHVMTWNMGAERLYGYKGDEILGKHFSTFYPEEKVREGWPDQELRLVVRDGRFEDEGWRIRKDGSRFLANVVITALFDRDGTLRGFGKVTRDVTERFTSAERALVESEARFRALADNIAQLAWMADTTGNLFWYNKRWFDYTGTTLDEMQGWGWKRVQHPEHLERVVGKWTRALADGRPWEDTFPLRAKEGTYRWFLSRAVPIHDEAGKVKLWFGTNTDVTDELETQETLRRAVHARDVFLSIASHELRTPLTPLSLQIQSLLRLAERSGSDLPTVKVKDKLVKATQQAAHLERLVANLLDVSRLGENRLRLEYEELDVATLVREIAERVRPEFEAAGSPLTVVARDEVKGSWDRLRLDQVISNLLGNALKYGRGKPIEVEVRRLDGEVLVSVRDHGIGIAAEDQERIFGRFERAVSPESYGGFGLGLWIARQLVDAMGGKISVQSKPGQGATFTVAFPDGGRRAA